MKHVTVPQTVVYLQKVRQLLVDKGWIQHRYSSEDGFCLVGAMTSMEVLTNVAMAGEQLLIKLAHTDLVGFNDNEYTTKADVLALIDKAIAHELANV